MNKSAFLVPLILYVLMTGILAYLALERTEGSWVYPLDDTYIHMAVAKQIVQTQDWALFPGAYHSCTSSPLYIVLLSGLFSLIGISEIAPFFLNLCGGIGLILVCVHYVGKIDLSSPQSMVLLILSLLILPLPFLTLLGMEHSIHLFFLGLLTYFFMAYLYRDGHASPLLISVLLMTATRYESMFIVVACAMVLWIHNRRGFAAMMLIVSFLPVIFFGFYSMYQGHHFLPYSILSKGHPLGTGFSDWFTWAERYITVLYENPFMFVLLLGQMAALIWLRQRDISWKDRRMALLIVGCVTTLLHVGFAEVGGGRYEAYVFLITLFAFFEILPLLSQTIVLETREMKIWWIALILLLTFPVTVRSIFFMNNYPLMSQNIYQQQYQLGHFVSKYLDGEKIAINDLGCMSFYSNAQVVDLAGISDPVMHNMLWSGKDFPYLFKNYVRNERVTFAIIHDEWFDYVIPRDWERIQAWTIPDNFINAFDRVSFYAADSASKVLLIQSLEEYVESLPSAIKVERFDTTN